MYSVLSFAWIAVIAYVAHRSARDIEDRSKRRKVFLLRLFVPILLVLPSRERFGSVNERTRDAIKGLVGTLFLVVVGLDFLAGHWVFQRTGESAAWLGGFDLAVAAVLFVATVRMFFAKRDQ